MARDHDPGDAVPPGVAPAQPVPLTPSDRAVRQRLERFGSERGRAAEMAQTGDAAEGAQGAQGAQGAMEKRLGEDDPSSGEDGEGI